MNGCVTWLGHLNVAAGRRQVEPVLPLHLVLNGNVSRSTEMTLEVDFIGNGGNEGEAIAAVIAIVGGGVKYIVMFVGVIGIGIYFL